MRKKVVYKSFAVKKKALADNPCENFQKNCLI